MQLHLPLLPHTLPTTAYCHCAYTQKLRHFVTMLRGKDYTVHVYESSEPWRPDQNLDFPFQVDHPVWQRQNALAIERIRTNVGPMDVLCLIAGLCQKPIADAFPQMPAVEIGVGYTGVFADFRIFESYFHMAHVYGLDRERNGRFFDAVIPNYYDVTEFPFTEAPENYLLFVGRLNDDKGIHVAADAARLAKIPLVVCGQGTPPKGCDYRGLVGVKERGRLMAHAKALICPTLYLEPFGGVAVEAQLCGTPVISTDWGGFTETVQHGETGYRCHTLGEFVQAVTDVETLDRRLIRVRAQARYGLDAIAPLYDAYFSRLALLWGDGWNTVAA